MKKYCSLILFTFLLNSCSDSSHTSEKNQNTSDTSRRDAGAITENKRSDDLMSSKILGAWTNHLTENATFDIQKGSVFYVDQMESYPYRLIDNKIVIQYPDNKYEATLSWLGDTLVFTDKENGATKFTRFTE